MGGGNLEPPPRTTLQTPHGPSTSSSSSHSHREMPHRAAVMSSSPPRRYEEKSDTDDDDAVMKQSSLPSRRVQQAEKASLSEYSSLKSDVTPSQQGEQVDEKVARPPKRVRFIHNIENSASAFLSSDSTMRELVKHEPIPSLMGEEEANLVCGRNMRQNQPSPPRDPKEVSVSAAPKLASKDNDDNENDEWNAYFYQLAYFKASKNHTNLPHDYICQDDYDVCHDAAYHDDAHRDKDNKGKKVFYLGKWLRRQRAILVAACLEADWNKEALPSHVQQRIKQLRDIGFWVMQEDEENHMDDENGAHDYNAIHAKPTSRVMYQEVSPCSTAQSSNSNGSHDWTMPQYENGASSSSRAASTLPKGSARPHGKEYELLVVDKDSAMRDHNGGNGDNGNGNGGKRRREDSLRLEESDTPLKKARSSSSGSSGRRPTIRNKPRGWEEYYQLALAYLKNNHNLSIPHRYTVPGSGIKLGQWAQAQRAAYSRKLRGMDTTRHYKISQSRVDRLNAIGFPWSLPRGSRPSSSSTNMDVNSHRTGVLEESLPKDKTPNSGMSSSLSLQSPVGCNAQPQHGRLLVNESMPIEEDGGKHGSAKVHDNGQESSMSARERRRNLPWDEHYKLLLKYREEYGNLSIPQRYKTPNGVKLGRWTGCQRYYLKPYLLEGDGHHAKVLTPTDMIRRQRINLLNAIEFEWDDSKAHRAMKRNLESNSVNGHKINGPGTRTSSVARTQMANTSLVKNGMNV